MAVSQIELKLIVLVFRFKVLVEVDTLSNVVLTGLEDDPRFELTQQFNRGETLKVLEVTTGTELKDAFDHLFIETIVFLVVDVAGESHMQNGVSLLVLLVNV
jgi:hypothetical protein